jgi:hypothetical protein
MKLENTVNKRGLLRMISMKRQILLLDFIADEPKSAAQILEHYESKSRLNYDLSYLKERNYIRMAYKKHCPIANKLAMFYGKTNKTFAGHKYIQRIESLQIQDLQRELNRLDAEQKMNRHISEYESKIVLVDKDNPHCTTYLNSNKPAGWYAWQRSKSDKVNRGIGSTFSMFDNATGGL